MFFNQKCYFEEKYKVVKIKIQGNVNNLNKGGKKIFLGIKLSFHCYYFFLKYIFFIGNMFFK
jgi:hypothetical protein